MYLARADNTDGAVGLVARENVGSFAIHIL